MRHATKQVIKLIKTVDPTPDRGQPNWHSVEPSTELRARAIVDSVRRDYHKPASTGRRLRLVLGGAGTVIVIAISAVVAQTILFRDNQPATSAAVLAMNSAADKINISDPQLGADQYRYVATRAWAVTTAAIADNSGTVTTMGLSYLQEAVSETWIPADPDNEWLQRGGSTGNYQWIVGSDEEARAAGVALPQPDVSELRAPRGEFFGPVQGSWQTPTQDFLASLPTDPKQLYDRLRVDTAGRGPDPNLEMLVYVADALRSGTVPARIRSNLLRALAMVPGLEITDKAANLDGRVGVAFGISKAGQRHEVIIDPGTGQFLGEREIAEQGFTGIPPGTVTAYTSVSTSVADSIGAKPTR